MRSISMSILAILLLLSCFGCSEAEPVPLTDETTTFAKSTVVEETPLTETKTSEETTTADPPITSEVPTTTTAAPTTTTAAPIKKPVAPVTTTKAPVHTHSFSAATCTSAPICACSATSGNALGHSYNSQGSCTRCGSVDEKYTLFIQEVDAISKEYLNEAEPIVQKIEECKASIESAEHLIYSAKTELASLSPFCPDDVVQQYVTDNWRKHENSYAAAEAVRKAWTQQYNNKKEQLNTIISIKQIEIQGLQKSLESYNIADSYTKEKYIRKLTALQLQYGYPLP